MISSSISAFGNDLPILVMFIIAHLAGDVVPKRARKVTKSTAEKTLLVFIFL